MKQVRFELEELPFSTLARFGLTQEMIEDLPMRVLEDLCQGRHSPVLPVRVRDENGEQVESRTRFCLYPQGRWTAGRDVLPRFEILAVGEIRRSPTEAATRRQGYHCRYGNGGRTAQQGIRAD